MMTTRSISRPHGSMIRGRRRAPGFSLVEVLMAIFILGVGIISIAALLPAGISQQQRSADDILGPIVAKNALSIVRTRVRPEDFGPDGLGFPGHPIGDWPWLRPALSEGGSIDVFNALQVVEGENTWDEEDAGVSNYVTGMPYNAFLHGADPPFAIITRSERVYPQGTLRPQYAWECAFRRRGGRIQVAVFVFRIGGNGGDSDPWVTPFPSGPDEQVIPHRLDLLAGGPEPWRGIPWNAFDIGTGGPARVLAGTDIDEGPYDLLNPDHQWQFPGQRMMDENGTVHEVLFGRRSESEGPVELERAPSELLAGGDTVLLGGGSLSDADGNGLFDQGTVSWLWYVPITTLDGRELTPVFIAVEDL